MKVPSDSEYQPRPQPVTPAETSTYVKEMQKRRQREQKEQKDVS